MDLEEIRGKIHLEITKTEQSIIEYRELTKPEAPDVAIGRVSRMDAINNRGVMEAALKQAEIKLQRLKLMLEKIDAPDFGICAKCKKPIPIERIMIKPESLLCVNCAQ